MTRIFISFLFIAVMTPLSFCQSYGFNAHLVGGVSAAQIRGDAQAGFRKLGIESGLGASFEFRYNMDVGIELLYSERGSRPDPDFPIASTAIFKMNYISVPVIYRIKDWLYEVDNGISYYKAYAEAGLSYGRLLDASIEGQLGSVGTQELVDAFNENDISWLIGVGVQFTEKFGSRVRYNRSITKLFKTTDHPNINSSDLLPFHLSLQLIYKL